MNYTTNGDPADFAHRETAEPADGRAKSEFMKKMLYRDAENVEQEEIEELEESLPKKLSRLKGELGENFGWIQTMLDRVMLLYEMIRDPAYRVPRKTVTLIAAGLIYFVLPTDLTPDFIPGFGYVDDALVLATLWRLVQDETQSYLKLKGSDE